MGGVLAGQYSLCGLLRVAALLVCRSFLTWLRRSGNGLDLDHHLRPEEFAHLDERAGGRPVRVDVLVTDRPDGRDLAHVGEEIVQLDDVAPDGVRGFESAGQVL